MPKAEEDMELTDTYKSDTIIPESPEIEFTAQYNIHSAEHQMRSSESSELAEIKQPAVSIVETTRSSLRKSLTESELESMSQSSNANFTTTINLNTFNEQKRIHRLLGSVLNKDYRFAQERQMKGFENEPPDISFAVAKRFENRSLELLELEINSLELQKNEVNRIESTLERALMDEEMAVDNALEIRTGSLDTDIEPLEIRKLKLEFSEHIPIFGNFKPQIEPARCTFTLMIGPVGMVRIDVGVSFRRMREQVFQARIAIGRQFQLVRHLVLGAVPPAYRLGFSGMQHHKEEEASSKQEEEESYPSYAFAGNQAMHLLLPFSDDPEGEFLSDDELLGDFLLLDFQSLLIDISKSLGELASLLRKLQADPRILTYLGQNEVYVCRNDKTAVIKCIFPLEAVCGGERFVGTEAILSLL